MLLSKKCLVIISIFSLSLYMLYTENLLLLYDPFLFCCLLVKSEVTENFLPFSLILFCKWPILSFKWQVTEYFLPVSQISSYKTVVIFHQYNRKFITSWSLWFLLPSCKVIIYRKFSAILLLQISVYFLKCFRVLGSKTCINVVSVRSLIYSM